MAYRDVRPAEMRRTRFEGFGTRFDCVCGVRGLLVSCDFRPRCKCGRIFRIEVGGFYQVDDTSVETLPLTGGGR